MAKEKVMNSPEDREQKPEEQPPRSNRSAGDSPQADDQNQATSEEFEEEGMGVAPRE
jgi:hypothetical protein